MAQGNCHKAGQMSLSHNRCLLQSTGRAKLVANTALSLQQRALLPGTLVPRATKAIALTPSFKLIKQPRWPATSPMMAVLPPINKILMTKVG